VEVPKSASASFRTWQLPAVDLSKEGMLYPIGAGDTVAAGTLAAWQYLHHHTASDSEKKFFGVVPSRIGKLLSDRNAEWSEGEEDEGVKMASAFAFGLSCGSSSCLKEENSVFEAEDAMKFFGGMPKPVVQ
jgi:hypothetical protein